MSKILILHGWTYSTDKWADFISQMKKQKMDVELLKIPGLTQEINKVWNLDDYVEWLKRKVNSQKDKVILIGHSNGGRISLAFAYKYPQYLYHLILIDSAGIYHNELSIRLKRIVFKTLAKVGRKITKSELMRKILYKLSRERDYKDATPLVRKTMQNLITSDISQKLDKIVTSTLIIWGEFDKVTPLQDGLVMHQLIKKSKLEIIKSAKHSPQFTHPKEVVKIIHEFI